MKHNDKQKNSILLILTMLVALALTLTGCGADKADTTDADAASSAQQGEAQVRTVGKLQRINETTGGYWGANTGDAYYEYARIGENNSMQALILKTDYATGEQSCLCQKSGCAHADESCNAYIENWGRIKLLAAKDMIYLSYTGMTNSRYYADTPEEKKELEDMRAQERATFATEEARLNYDAQVKQWDKDLQREREQCSYIDVIRADGSEKRRLVDFPKEMEADFYYTDGAVLYGSYMVPDDSEVYGERFVGLWVDMETGEYDTFETDAKSFSGVFENMLVTVHTASDQDLNALMQNENFEAYEAAFQNATREYYAMNPFTGESKWLTSLPASMSDSPKIINNKLYYKTRHDNDTTADIKYIDLATGQETVFLSKTPASWSFAYMLDTYMPMGQPYQRYQRAYDESNYNATQERLLDLETGEILKIPLALGTFEFGSTTPVLAAQTNDGRFLIMIGSMTTKHNSRCRYALIAPEDYVAGNPKYTEVKMHETA